MSEIYKLVRSIRREQERQISIMKCNNQVYFPPTEMKYHRSLLNRLQKYLVTLTLTFISFVKTIG